MAREALRLGLKHHKTIATRLKGVKPVRTIDDFFEQALEESYINMMNIDIIVGTGGLLSHAPRRAQSLLILTDAFQPEGVTRVFQDSVFMMPHLGVLSTVYEEAAWQIFDKDCCIRLGTVIAPKGIGKYGDEVFSIKLDMPDGSVKEEKILFGEIKRLELPIDQEARAIITPRRSFDVGAGPGHKLKTILTGGVVGAVLDGRGRPIQIPEEPNMRKKHIINWFDSLSLYPVEKEAIKVV